MERGLWVRDGRGLHVRQAGDHVSRQRRARGAGARRRERLRHSALTGGPRGGDAAHDRRSQGGGAHGRSRASAGNGDDLARCDSEASGAGAVMWRRCAMVLAAIGALAALHACAPVERETLNARQLETPRFDPPPAPSGTALHTLRRDLTGEPGRAILSRFVPSQGAVLVIALLVMLAVGFDWNRPRHPRNLEMLALLPIGFLLFDCMRYFELFEDPIYWQLMDAVFIAIMAVSVFLLIRALLR